MSYTKGKWVFSGRFIFSDARALKPICEIPEYGIHQSKQDLANARLIAAAPDLLKALARIEKKADKALRQDEIQRGIILNEIGNITAAAIAKAEKG